MVIPIVTEQASGSGDYDTVLILQRAPLFCGECGTLVSVEDQYCGQCGLLLEDGGGESTAGKVVAG